MAFSGRRREERAVHVSRHEVQSTVRVLGKGGRDFLLLAAGHLAWQAWRIDFDDPKDCLAKFKANRDFGLVLFAGAIAARLVA